MAILSKILAPKGYVDERKVYDPEMIQNTCDDYVLLFPTPKLSLWAYITALTSSIFNAILINFAIGSIVESLPYNIL